MTWTGDFEKTWREQFADCIDAVAGEEVRREVMPDGKPLPSGPREVIDWTRGAMERLDALLDERTRREVMTGCACRYPLARLQAAREAYGAAGDVAAAHRVLQEQFESFLRDLMGMDEDLVGEVLARGWGLAGALEGNRVVATKIPKSGNLEAYLRATDPEKRRRLYCHCPRVRGAVEAGVAIPETYCYCGAGYYRAIWEEIVQQPVEVEVLESVLAGGEVCAIAIHLPKKRR